MRQDSFKVNHNREWYRGLMVYSHDTFQLKCVLEKMCFIFLHLVKVVKK